jgi:hypothetical protein
MKKLLFLPLVLIVTLLVIESRYVNRWIVQQATSQLYDAKIFGFTSDVVGSWGGELIIYQKNNNTIIKRVLLITKRDVADEVSDEFKEILIDGRTVKIIGDFKYYKGEKIIRF